MKGTIIKGIGGFYYVKTSDNVYECKARGIFRKKHITPTIGDRVEIEANSEKGNIVDIYERSSYLARPAVANIDTMLLVTAAAQPEPSFFLIDKMLVNAEINHVIPALCINKTDIADRRDIADIYSKAGYKIFLVSAQTKDGLPELEEYLTGKVTAFAGLSGVGKSSLLSIITNDTLETGSVSEKISRGRHTTRHIELFELQNGGFALDTPGFSSLEIEDIKADELWRYFPEMRDGQDRCRFRGCSHINEPDCFIKEKVDKGEFALSRYESYLQLYNQLKTVKEWERK